MSRYRLLPTPAQEAVLRDHCAHARFTWNLGGPMSRTVIDLDDDLVAEVSRSPGSSSAR